MKKLLIALGLSIFLLPAFASALTQAAASFCPDLSQDMWVGSCDQNLADADCARRITGDQVSQLQHFLKDYFNNPTGLWLSGYFGNKSKSFVTKFQDEWDVPATGRVGPLTRAAIKQACGSSAPDPLPPPPNCPDYQIPLCEGGALVSNGTDARGCSLGYRCERTTACSTIGWVQPTTGCDGTWVPTFAETGAACQNGWKCVPSITSSGSFSATPTSGQASLTVNFTSTFGDLAAYPPSYVDGQDTKLDFGDGTELTWLRCSGQSGSNGVCSSPITVQHTYAQTGTYTAKVKKVGGYCAWSCPETVLSTVTITVSAGTPGQKCGVNSFGVQNQCNDLTSAGYGSAYVQCYDGYSTTLYSASTAGWIGSCKSSDVLRREAEVVCANRCASVTPQTGVLNVTPSYGAAPLTVKAIFPTEWQSLVNSECSITSGRFGGRTFSVDWGDGTFPNQNGRNAPCLYHTYTAAGTYTVKGKIYDFSDVNEYSGSFTRDAWLGSAQVAVTGSDTGNGLPSITVGSPGTGLTVAQGQVLRLSWAARNMPANSAVGLWLINSVTGGRVGSIALGQSGTGTYEWTVPGSRCDASGSCRTLLDSPQAYYTEPGRYHVVAEIYTPASACYGFCPSSSQPTVITKGESGIFIISAFGATAGNQNVTLSVSPPSGAAPLSVTFLGNTGAGCNGGYFTLNYGDGTSDTIAQPADACNGSFRQNHTYSFAGRYTATIEGAGKVTAAAAVSVGPLTSWAEQASASNSSQMASALIALEVALGALKTLLAR